MNADRPHISAGMGGTVPGSIAWSLVRLWAEHHQMTRGEHAMLDRLICAMDAEFIKWWHEHHARTNPR